MKVKILTVGKARKPEYKNLSREYCRRIAPYLPIELQWVREEKIASLSKKEILRKEGMRIKEKLDPSEHTVVLDRTAKPLSSKAFSVFLQKKQLQSIKGITFIIGGPLGVDNSILQSANTRLSLSRMTFAHELTLVIILEQIYRALSIQHGGKYHK